MKIYNLVKILILVFFKEWDFKDFLEAVGGEKHCF